MSGAKTSFAGMLRVVRFNWPMYVFALAVILAFTYLSFQAGLGALRPLLILGAVYAFYQTAASLVASWWVYDLSQLRNWQWLVDLAPPERQKIVHVYAGYDESWGRVKELFGSSDYAVIDFYDALPQREASIVRARKLYRSHETPVSSSLSQWPIAEASVDLVLIAFAAHEIREAHEREALFGQIGSVLKADGRVILVEHLRDFANTLAFGPGVLHFLSESEWLRCAASANLKVIRKLKITPLVEVFVLCR